MKKDFDLKLGYRAKAMILRERDHQAMKLIARAVAMLGLSAEEYIASGIERNELTNNELVGVMTRSGWKSIEYDVSQPGWRARWENGIHTYEGYRRADEVAEVFASLRKAK